MQPDLDTVEFPEEDKSIEMDDLLDKVKRDVSNDAEGLTEQRDMANAAMRFVNVPGGQWEDHLSKEFANRTKLEFDQTSGYLNKFLGEWDLNRLGVEFKPEDSKTSDDDAEMLNGIWRADFKDGSGKMSLDNAVDEAATCGYGCFKIAPKFVDDDPENDLQRIEFRPIINAYERVIWDRAAQRIDKADARRCTVLEPYTPDSFHEVYGDDESAVTAYTPYTSSRNDFTAQSKVTIYIATRYEVVRKKELHFIYSNLSTNEIETYNEEDHELIVDELRRDKFRKKIRERKITRQVVMKSIFSGEKFLMEPKRIAGKHIPIIPIYGYHSYVDGMEHYFGLVQKLMDPQRLLNMQMSQLAENSASSGQPVPVFDPDQMPDNIAALWANRNNKPYMLAKSLRDDEGKIIQHGPTMILPAAQLDGSTAALLQIVPQHIQQATGGAPQDTLNPDASGKAINALIKRENLKTHTIMDNTANSVERSGEVYQSIAAETYNSRRALKTLGMDGQQGEVQMLQEIQDETTGKIITINTLHGRKFKAYSDTGPQYESLREQTVEDIKGMMELLLSAGEVGAKYVPILASMMLKNMAGVGLKDFKAFVRKDLIAQGIQKPETDEEKAMVQDLQEQQNQPDPQQQLMEAAAKQAESEGEKFLSEARNLDSKSIDNIASARKKAAETRKILAEVGTERTKAMTGLLKLSSERAEDLPFGAS